MHDEVCRSPLRLAYQLGQGKRRREAHQQMHVVLDAADRNDLRSKFHSLRPDRPVDPSLDLLGQQGQPVPGRPDAMDEPATRDWYICPSCPLPTSPRRRTSRP